VNAGKNMTEEHLEAVMAAMPDNMDVSELCALTLTIHAAYLDTQVEIISALISTIYTYGMSQGCNAVYTALADKRDLSAEDLETLSNRIGRLAWERGRV